MHRFIAILALLAAFLSRAPVLAQHQLQRVRPEISTNWIDVATPTVFAGTSKAVPIALPPVPPNATNITLQYEIDMRDPVTGFAQQSLVYAVENLSLSSACSGYDGTYGAGIGFKLGSQHLSGGIGFHVGMCGGVSLTKFDGAVDFTGPNGIPYGGSGHNFGTGFPVYRGDVPIPPGALVEGGVVHMTVTPTLGFSSWNGDSNWISAGLIDGERYRVRARVLFHLVEPPSS